MHKTHSCPILIHVGFHKTGTTFLQKNLFFRRDRGFVSPWTVDSGEAIEHFVLSHPCRFDASKIRHLFWKAIEDTKAEELIPTISHEDLSGHPVKQKYYEFEVADRIQQVFPEAKILINIREQKSIIKSFYNQYIKQDGTFGLRYFLGDENRRTGFSPLFRLDHLEYDLLIGRYIEHFGPDSVLVIPQEILAQNQQLFLERVYGFVGNNSAIHIGSEPANVSMGAATIELRRWLNSFMAKQPPLWDKYEATTLLWRAKNRLCRHADKMLPEVINKQVENRLKKSIECRVGNYYSESNHRLQKLVDFDLKELGYML